ncbi:MAG: twin-arginine translocation signal domain-containing protein, partial [Acidobacteria bacterium]|nr:twin-arginine translocation signal domain-containing protein [Acidobacteriota bacterium]MCA1650123.1 twin-arginine translocation signal domain-containing protein [Acidobacteriota bacterium]
MTDNRIDSPSRREFLQTAAVASAALAVPPGLFAAGSDIIRVGLVGCGGRGTGAAADCLRGSEGVELVALGDLVPDRLDQCRAQLAKAAAENADFAAKYKVTDERCFTGFDAYEK